MGISQLVYRNLDRAYDLLEDAEDFLGAARDLLEKGRWAKVCFNCQQGADLALKAALNANGLERRGHDLSEMVNELLGYGENLEMLRDAARLLDQYYIQTRYPNAFSEGPAMRHYTRKQAVEAISYAENILREAKNIVTKRKTTAKGK